MKGKGDNPIVGSETTDIYDGENHGYKENNSLEKDDLRAFATHWTWRPWQDFISSKYYNII